jgi:squalene-hopene/tetraprenyl-beta-curcumene cyclase
MRRALMAGAAFVAALAASSVGGDGARERAVAYLWAQQGEDGGWHSRKYGLLRSGQSLTPFVALALIEAGAAGERTGRAAEFVRRHVNEDGALGLADPVAPDYPNYATALGAVLLLRTGHRGEAARMTAYLRRQQFSEDNGWAREHPAYGGWGMGGEVRRPPEPGHVDLSMTRYVLEALREAGAREDDPAFARAAVFVERCRNADGGFFFSPVEMEINKAGEEGDGPRSYGSATADGILALRAMGRKDARAEAWLAAHHREETTPGFAAGARMAWAEGLHFYYAAAARKVDRGLRVRLAAQRADGSFANRLGLVKEDDPLIATALAVQALAK